MHPCKIVHLMLLSRSMFRFVKNVRKYISCNIFSSCNMNLNSLIYCEDMIANPVDLIVEQLNDFAMLDDLHTYF